MRHLALTASAAAIAALLATPVLADRRVESKTTFERGFDRFERGDLRGARIEMLKALQADPNNARARIVSARIALEAGAGVQAQTELEKAIKSGAPKESVNHLMAHALILQNNPNGASRLVAEGSNPPQFASYAARMRGRIAVIQDDDAKATAEFRQAVALAPTNDDAMIDLGRHLMRQGVAAEAMTVVDRALAGSPNNVKALILKGDMVRASQGLEASLPFFNRALDADPNNVEALLERAGTLGDLRREAAARADLKKIQGLAPDQPLALYLEAVLESRAGRYQQANALMTRTKGILNGYPPAGLLQGMLAYQLGNLTVAEDALGKVLAQVPQSDLARKLYAAVLLQKNDATGALNALQPLMGPGQNPDARVLALAGSAHAKKGEYAEAQALMQRATTSAPKEPSLRTQLAMTRIAQGDTAGAKSELGQVLAADPKSPQALMMTALIQMREEKFKEAFATASRMVTANPKNPAGYNMRGAAALGLGNSKGAEANFRLALQQDPKFSEARRNLAQLLIATNREAEGQRELTAILAANGKDARAMVALAELARNQGKRDEQINWLKQAVATSPQNTDYRTALVQAYVQAGQINRGLTEAAALDRDNPKNPQVVELLGVTQMAARNLGNAESTFNRLVTLAPTLTGPRVLLARAQAQQGRANDARATYTQALTLTGQNLVPVYIDLIGLEARARNMPAATALVNRMRAATPGQNIADQVLGDINMNAGNFPAALAAYQNARKIRFDRSTAMRMSTAHTRMRQPQQAIAVLQEFRKANPDDLLALAAIADIQLQTRQYARAIAIYEQLRKQGAARDPAVLNNLAWAYHKSGNSAAALPIAENAARIAPGSPAVLDTLGLILTETGKDTKRAAQILVRAVNASPGDPNIRFHLAKAHVANDKRADAVRELNRALTVPRFDNRAAAQALLAKIS
jgi:putative PEP-CTERM system TPR-repeat lipoprotein